ncbi:hypothetical protein V2J56_08280 [Georgenia sp. MJ206]|uniref:hypothetical protein n=1 Tax=Georgenia wangjunii TaxID=3117730 RepID=UPI002F266997
MTHPSLPAVPDADDVRALARSSPWRWRSVRFTVRWTRDLAAAPVRAWVARPASLRVEGLDGTLVEAGVEQRGQSARFQLVLAGDGGRMAERYRDAPEAAPAVEAVPARDVGPDRAPAPGLSSEQGSVSGPAKAPAIAWVSDLDPVPAGFPGAPPGDEPVFRPDGLVARRPWLLRTEADAPMHQDYRWVAMLDPLELAEPFHAHPDEAEPATELTEVAVVDHHGRPAWEAVVRTLPGYDPRCSCCPLLGSAEADAREAEGGAPPRRPTGFAYPDAFRVRLDVGTGICVYTEELGGTRPGTGHDLTLEEVDADMPADLFTTPRTRGWRR